MKTISNRRYEELLKIEEKYRFLVGETFTFCTGGRSTRQRLLNLSKDELVYKIIVFNNYVTRLEKEIIKEIGEENIKKLFE